MTQNKKLNPYHAFIGAVSAIIITVFLYPLLFSKLGTELYLIISQLIIVAVAVIITAVSGVKVKEIVPLKKISAGKIFASIGMYIGVIFLNNAITKLSEILFSAGKDQNIQIINQCGTVVSLLLLALVPAICEEIFYRGFLLSGFEPVNNPTVSVIAVGIIFAGMHFNINNFVATATLGVLFSYIVYKTGSILISAILHFLNNAILVLGVSFLPERMLTDFLYGNIEPLSKIGTALLCTGIAVPVIYFSFMRFNAKRPGVKISAIILSAAAVPVVLGFIA